MTDHGPNARAFVIWRAASEHGWNCSVPELARATGIAKSTVRDIAKKRGWKLVNDRQHVGGQLFGQVQPLDQVFA